MKLLSAFSDAELVAAMKAGEQIILKEIIDRYWKQLLAIAINRLNVLEDAEECLQDVFYNLWKKRETIELRHSLATYLSVAVKYQVFNLLDKKYRRIITADLTDDAIVLAAGQTDDYMLEKELFSQLERTVRELPEKCQIVYRLSREEGKTNKQIAVALEISEKTVEAHLTKALKGIRANLTLATLPIFILLFEN